MSIVSAFLLAITWAAPVDNAVPPPVQLPMVKPVRPSAAQVNSRVDSRVDTKVNNAVKNKVDNEKKEAKQAGNTTGTAKDAGVPAGTPPVPGTAIQKQALPGSPGVDKEPVGPENDMQTPPKRQVRAKRPFAGELGDADGAGSGSFGRLQLDSISTDTRSKTRVFRNDGTKPSLIDSWGNRNTNEESDALREPFRIDRGRR